MGGEGRKKTKWDMAVEMIHTAFREGELTEEAAWQGVVLFSKGGGDYRGIGIVEMMWKAVTVILNRRFTASIAYHDSLRRSQAGRNMGTSNLKF